ncbi:MAG: GGDEF domain-containing protein, partial [Candidatus Eremiobacterota bacterium]
GKATLRMLFPDSLQQEVLYDLYRGATRDGLTGVLNKTSFLRHLEEAHSSLSRVRGDPEAPDRRALRREDLHCVAMVDADHFKRVNDTLGHAAGDEVLRELARRLEGNLRQGDLVGRYGGEEFVLLLWGAGLPEASQVLERVRAAVAGQPFTVPTSEGPRELMVTISLGVAPLNGHDSPKEAIQAADQALYRAKSQGRNRLEQCGHSG